MKIRSMSSTSFHFQSTLQEWEQVRDWMTKNNIMWRPIGNKVMVFDKQEHALMFALRWL